MGKTAVRLGEGRPLASMADDEIGAALELLWGSAAVNTWNSGRAAVLSWLGWCRERGYEAPMVPAWTKRLAVPGSETPARSNRASLPERQLSLKTWASPRAVPQTPR